MAFVDIIGIVIGYSIGISIIGICIGILYTLYVYIEIDALKSAYCILTLSVAASLWQLASSYNRYPPPSSQHHLLQASVQYRSGWQEVHTPSSYQISPDGVKSYYNGVGLPTLEEDTVCLVKKVSIYFLRIFYGDGEKRLACIHKTICDMSGEVPSFEFTSKRFAYEGDHKLIYPYNPPLLQIQAGQDAADAGNTLSATSYNKRPAYILTRQEVEYTTGHKTVQKMKIDTTVY